MVETPNKSEVPMVVFSPGSCPACCLAPRRTQYLLGPLFFRSYQSVQARGLPSSDVSTHGWESPLSQMWHG